MKKIIMNGIILDYIEERNKFIAQPEEVRLDFCDSFDEYVYRMNGIIVDKIYSVDEYTEEFTPNEGFTEHVSIEMFDKVIADEYGLWNYPLEETEYLLKEEKNVVLVKFYEGYRLVEIPERQI